jgi:predicted dehydrogenase
MTVEAVLLGAGQRGFAAAGAFAENFPEELKFVAVAEPDEEKRGIFAEKHGIPEDKQFKSYMDLLKQPRLAPVCFNMTMDYHHLESALAALDKGYHLILEKPMAPTAKECLQIVEAAEKAGTLIQIIHPLRFTPFYLEVKRLLMAGAVGDIVSMSLQENIAYWHYAHSYVRGNWRRADESGPMILTKCCHDMDLIAWLAGSSVKRVASFGSLKFFQKDYAPAGAPERCLDGCPVEKTCPFYAPAVYLTDDTDWPTSVISVKTDLDSRRKALEEGPYGRCVFQTDNNVVDQQVAIVEFESGATTDFTVRAETNDCFRAVRVIGTEGELNGHFENRVITVNRFVPGTWQKGETEYYHPESLEGGHGGGDTGVIRHFLQLLHEDKKEVMLESLQIALEGHILAFAAEESRKSGEAIQFKEFKAKHGS